MKKLIFILLILIIICYFQHESINKSEESYEIIQYDNPTKNILEKMLSEKKITIITGMDLSPLQYDNFYIGDIQKSLYANIPDNRRKDILKHVYDYFNYYYIPICVKSDVSLNYEGVGTQSILNYQQFYRYGFCLLKGMVKLYLFSPKNLQLLYFNKNTQLFDVDFWNQDIKKYPNVTKSKYVEIILRVDQMIFIPHQWIFCYEVIEESTSVAFFSESLFSNLLKK